MKKLSFPVEVLIFLLFLLSHIFNDLSAAENSINGTQGSGESEEEEEANRLLDQLYDPFPSRYLDENEDLDSTNAVDRLMDKISDIRERQCFACIQGLRYFSHPDSDQLEELLETLIPYEYRAIIALRPLLV